MILLQAAQAELLAALQRVVGVVERRHAVPILANVLLRKTGRTIEFTTTDLELQLRTRAELGGDAGEFATTVNARKLVEILRAMPADQTVSLRSTADRLTLHGGRSRFTLQTLPAHDFPQVREAADHGAPFEMPQAVLKRLIAQVGFAMAVQDIRYFLNGVLFLAEGMQLTLVATDGNRLARARATVERELPRQAVILPRKTVLELQRLLRGGAVDADTSSGGDGAPVRIRLAAAQAIFEFAGIECVSQLIEGRYPDHERVIPRANPNTVTLGRAPLLAALQRVALLTSDKFRGVRLSLAPNALRIASSNAQHEEADEDLDVDYAGEPLEIGFNVTYLLDLLSGSGDERVTIALQDARSGALFSFAGREGFLYVVSPMRL